MTERPTPAGSMVKPLVEKSRKHPRKVSDAPDLYKKKVWLFLIANAGEDIERFHLAATGQIGTCIIFGIGYVTITSTLLTNSHFQKKVSHCQYKLGFWSV